MFWFGFSPADPPPSEPAVIRIIEIAGRTKIPDKEGCSPLFSMFFVAFFIRILSKFVFLRVCTWYSLVQAYYPKLRHQRMPRAAASIWYHADSHGP